jgi:hypothetical protein
LRYNRFEHKVPVRTITSPSHMTSSAAPEIPKEPHILVRRSTRGSRRQPHNSTSDENGPIRNPVSAMDQGAFMESSDEDPADELNDHRPNQQLSCPSCDATNFPNLSKLKSVLVTATCGYYLANTEAASIETRTISLTNA